MVGLSDKADAYPAQLSGGQKQRVGIARALANNPSVLLCDEATSALDPNTTKSILKLLKKINKELGLTIVLITHEMEVVKEICDRMAVMQDGKIVEEGPVYDLFAEPKQPLTKQFIETILQFELPPHLRGIEKRESSSKFNSKDPSLKKASSLRCFRRYKVRGNILHGKIEYIQEIPLGIFIMELIGSDDEIEAAIRYITAKTQSLEVLEDAA